MTGIDRMAQHFCVDFPFVGCYIDQPQQADQFFLVQ